MKLMLLFFLLVAFTDLYFWHTDSFGERLYIIAVVLCGAYLIWNFA